MKSYLHHALALLLLCIPALAQTTPNLGMNIPAAGSSVGTWGPVINSNFTLLDSLLGGTSALSVLLAKNFESVRYSGDWCSAPPILDQTCVANAIANLPVGGGIVILPLGNVSIASTVTVNTSNVQLIGYGGDEEVGTPAAPTTFTWTGAGGGTMFKITSVSGASNNIIKRSSISNALINCNNSAGIGLDIESLTAGSFSGLTVLECTTEAIKLGSVATLAGGIRGNSYNSFRDINTRTSTSGGIGWLLTGDTLVDSNANTWNNILCRHKNGVCLDILDGDANSFTDFRVYRDAGGVAAGVVLDNAIGGNVSSNYFYRLEAGSGGLVQQNGASENVIWGYELGNGEPAPTIGSGTLTYLTNGAVSTPSKLFLSQAAGAASDGFSASAHMITTCPVLTTTAASVTWCSPVFDKAITVTRVTLVAQTAPTGCSTSPQFGFPTAKVALANAATNADSGVISVNIAAANVGIGVQNVDAGCGVQPANVMVTIEYNMQ